jgi:U4/U6 small nuclear ribonucleoprotein PRP3
MNESNVFEIKSMYIYMNIYIQKKARKLTPAERKDKKRKKLQEDTSREVTVALFKVKDLSSPHHQFKVDVNASQNSLTGGVLTCKGIEDEFGGIVLEPGDEALTLVVVEGGPKAIAR